MHARNSTGQRASPGTVRLASSLITRRASGVIIVLASLIFVQPSMLLAHVVAAGDKGYILCTEGIRLVPFAYLGAKHMVTGYDHVLFLLGVMFFLYRPRDVAVYVSLFALGHSITLISGVAANVRVSPFLIDGIIALSIVYKAFENNGLFLRWFGFQPDTMAATLFFGLCHGLGLATRMQDFEIQKTGLMQNLIAFNVGVEIGQLCALALIFMALSRWRRTRSFMQHSFAANVVLAAAGVLLLCVQVAAYFGATAA